MAEIEKFGFKFWGWTIHDKAPEKFFPDLQISILCNFCHLFLTISGVKLNNIPLFIFVFIPNTSLPEGVLVLTPGIKRLTFQKKTKRFVNSLTPFTPTSD